jgi:WD40 repeat protein
MEFRGHDHIIEIAVFAPAVAYPAIRELAGLPVRSLPPMMLGDLSIVSQKNDRSTKPASYIATASRDKTIKLWDCQTGQMLRNLVCFIRHFTLSSKRTFLHRLVTITGSELSSSIRQANSFSLLVTIILSGCGNCPQVDA